MEFNNLIDRYCSTVNEFFDIVCSGVGVTSKEEFIKLRLESQVHEFNYENKKIIILFHGRGCKIQINESEIDWDFGYNSLLYGINPYNLKKFIENEFKVTYDMKYIDEYFNNLILKNQMYKKYGLYYLR